MYTEQLTSIHSRRPVKRLFIHSKSVESPIPHPRCMIPATNACWSTEFLTGSTSHFPLPATSIHHPHHHHHHPPLLNYTSQNAPTPRAPPRNPQRHPRPHRNLARSLHGRNNAPLLAQHPRHPRLVDARPRDRHGHEAVPEIPQSDRSERRRLARAGADRRVGEVGSVDAGGAGAPISGVARGAAGGGYRGVFWGVGEDAGAGDGGAETLL